MYVRVYVCACVCMHVCLYVCMCICMYVRTTVRPKPEILNTTEAFTLTFAHRLRPFEHQTREFARNFVHKVPY